MTYQFILDNTNWHPRGTQRYLVLTIPRDENLNFVIHRLINIYIFTKYGRDIDNYDLLPRETDNFWLYQRNWWNFFYFLHERVYITDTSKPIWYIMKKYNISPEIPTLTVRTRNSKILNERITRDDMANMTNYHKLLDEIFFYLPSELTCYICDFIY